MKLVTIIFIIMSMLMIGCELEPPEPKSTTGVSKVTARVKVQANGMTVEQENVRKRIEAENIPGSLKHLYIMSAYSGQVLVYSTVKGKVTSSGKRLTPYSVAASDGDYVSAQHAGIKVNIGGKTHRTGEVLQDDGTYGSSIPYLYWWDTKGLYHQHYVSGGQIIHVSDKPLPVKNIVINMELTSVK